MNKFKKVIGNFTVLSVFCIVMGIALIIRPDLFTRVVGLVIGGIITTMGAVALLRYLIRTRTDPDNASGLVSGVVLIIAGVFVMVRPDFIPKVIAFVFGAYMLISGITNIQGAFLLKKTNSTRWTKALVIAGLTTLAGMMLVINPILLADVTARLMGVCLLISGMSNIGGTLLTGRNKNNPNIRFDNRDNGQNFIDIN
ncbi:HdeD family acid-resistance protein [Ruminococcus albus]|uniref:Uncharacterized membrane protein HdeD, DUF308 family n=1 Tax=Ruminococcus albus TaxID=1264 RepID=A0A1I1K158_RUMAL|nr:DUF308 domain-containing protein [Ruminococcus albus]SFC54687.1 Uncharacterized membrane protein HdeD, DUF308 family [Ruminococcus albus]